MSKPKSIKPPAVPKFTSSLGEPPPVLSGRSLEIWHELVRDMEAAGVGCRVERHPLSALCLAINDVEQAEIEIQRLGLVVETARGTVKNPAFTIKVSAITLIHKLAASFGLTPASRGRVIFNAQSSEDHAASEAIRLNDPSGYARWVEKYGEPPTNEFACL